MGDPHIPQPSDICTVCGNGLVHIDSAKDARPSDEVTGLLRDFLDNYEFGEAVDARIRAALAANPAPAGPLDGWIVKSASAERDYSDGDYTAIVVVNNDGAEPGHRYRQGYGEGTTVSEAIATAHQVALANTKEPT